MKKLLFLTFLWGFLLPLNQQEIDLLKLIRKSTQDTELVEKIDKLLSQDKKPSRGFKTSTYIKATCILCATVVTILVSLEILRILLGNELLLNNTKKLYAKARGLSNDTKNLQQDTQGLRDSNEELREAVNEGVIATEDLLEKVHEISDSRDIEEKLARNDVELFARINKLEGRLKALNGDAFLSLSEALNLSPRSVTPIISPKSRMRSNSVYVFNGEKDE